MRGGGRSRVTAEKTSELTRHGAGGPGRDPPPHPTLPWGGPKLPNILPKTYVANPVTGRGVTGRGLKLDQPPGITLHTATNGTN